MGIVIDDALLPATFSSAAMTDDEFTAFCAEHPDLQFEMIAERKLHVMAPTHSVRRRRDIVALRGDEPVAEFILELSEVRNPSE